MSFTYAPRVDPIQFTHRGSPYVLVDVRDLEPADALLTKRLWDRMMRVVHTITQRTDEGLKMCDSESYIAKRDAARRERPEKSWAEVREDIRTHLRATAPDTTAPPDNPRLHLAILEHGTRRIVGAVNLLNIDPAGTAHIAPAFEIQSLEAYRAGIVSIIVGLAASGVLKGLRFPQDERTWRWPVSVFTPSQYERMRPFASFADSNQRGEPILKSARFIPPKPPKEPKPPRAEDHLLRKERSVDERRRS